MRKYHQIDVYIYQCADNHLTFNPLHAGDSYMSTLIGKQ